MTAGLVSEAEVMRHKKLWASALANVSDEQISFAIEYCIKHKPLNERSEDWPPNAREFLEFCRLTPKKCVSQITDEREERAKKIREEIFSISEMLRVYEENLSKENAQRLRTSLEKLKLELKSISEFSNVA